MVLTSSYTPTAGGIALMPPMDSSACLQIADAGADVVRALGVRAQAQAASGEPAHVLAEVAQRGDYDLVIVGHRGLSQATELVLGSVTKKLASEAPCPVLVVRGTAPEDITKVLAAVDGSAYARRATEVATEVAQAFGARMTLLYVLDVTLLMRLIRVVDMSQVRQELFEAGQRALAQASGICQQAGLRCDTAQAEGQPAEVIARWARDGGYEIVALGRRGMSDVARHVLGGVSDAVLRDASPLVLVAGEQAKSSPSGA